MKVMTVGPLLRSAQVNLTPGVIAGVVDVSRLQNPSRTPWLVDEIRFRFSNIPVNTFDNGPASFLVSVQLDLGGLPLTATHFIPIALLCRALDGSVEATQRGFTWRLPKPLYVPAGKTVVPKFRLDGDFQFRVGGAPGVTVNVTMVGRVLPSGLPEPTIVDVPFASAWRDDIRLGGQNYLAVRSVSSDLKNPHGEVLYVQQMLGGYVYQNPSYGTFIGGGSTAPSQISTASGTADMIGNDLLFARIFKSDGKVLARSAAPWNHLFDWTTRALQSACTILERNEFYQIQADLYLSSLAARVGAGGAGADGDKIRLMASVIGYRRVAFRNGAFLES